MIMCVYYASLYYKNDHVTGANKRFDEIGRRLLAKYKSQFKCIVTEDNRPTWCPIENSLFIPSYNSKLQRITSWFRFSILLNKLPSGILINDFMPSPVMFFKKKHKHLQLIHDLRNFDEYKRGGLGFLTSHFQKWELLKADKLITVSKYTADMINMFCGKKHSDIIISYNGVDGNISISNKPRDIDILYIATFEPRKNHMRLLKSLEQFENKLNVVLVGSDLGLKKHTQEYAKYISDNYGHNIRFYEQISEDELHNLYYTSKVFCSPSLYEGFGMPIVEAYQHGCQVVCSDIEVFKEVTLNKALYFNPKSENKIYEALNLALNSNNPDLLNISEEVVGFFSWDKIFDRLCKSIERENYDT